MNLSKIQLKKNELVLMSIVVLVLFALFHFSWKNSNKMLTLNAVRASSMTAKSKLIENQSLYEKLIKREPASQGFSADYMDQYILANDHFSSAITGIVNSSKSKAFTLIKLSLEDQSSDSGYKKMLYSLDAEASFIEIGKFLEKLEDAPLLTEVTSIEINRIDTEMKRCQAHIKLYSYVRSE